MILANRSMVLAGLYLAGATLALFTLFRSWSYDDPFITYRYADNLRRGLGFVYNSGEHVQSTTTPLFTILLALLGTVWSDLPHVANLIGAFSLALGALFLWHLAGSWGSPIVGWVALLLYPTFSLLLATLGSELPLYIMLCLGAFLFYVRRQYTLTAMFAAFSLLTRADGALVGIILATDYMLRVRKPIPWFAVWLFLGLSAAWFLFAWSYFGSPAPATLAAKQSQGAMAISTLFAPSLLTIIQGYVRWPYRLELALALFGILFLLVRARRWMLFLVWPCLYLLAYSALGVTQYFWYYAPLVPGFLVLVGLAISGVQEVEALLAKRFFLHLKERCKAQGRAWHLSQTMPVLALLGLPFVFQGFDLWQLRTHPDERVPIYTAVGQWLHENTAPDALIGTLEVGIIGYYAERPMLDFAGLIQPQVSAHMSRSTTYEDTALWAVGEYKPEYLVLQDYSFPRLEQGYLSQNCSLVQSFEGQTYGSPSNLRVYRCAGSHKLG